jgi:N-methylhydantoinase A/oxoprolinase/acetone carboxylase beta subunit
MLQRARRDMSGEGVDAAKCRYDFALWEDSAAGVTQLPLDDAALKALKASNDMRLVLSASYELPAFQLSSDRAARSATAPIAGSTQVLYGSGAGDATPIVDVAALEPGHYADGPALLRSSYLTCLLDRGWSMRVSDNHDLIIEEA